TFGCYMVGFSNILCQLFNKSCLFVTIFCSLIIDKLWSRLSGTERIGICCCHVNNRWFSIWVAFKFNSLSDKFVGIFRLTNGHKYVFHICLLVLYTINIQILVELTEIKALNFV